MLERAAPFLQVSPSLCLGHVWLVCKIRLLILLPQRWNDCSPTSFHPCTGGGSSGACPPSHQLSCVRVGDLRVRRAHLANAEPAIKHTGERALTLELGGQALVPVQMFILGRPEPRHIPSSNLAFVASRIGLGVHPAVLSWARQPGVCKFISHHSPSSSSCRRRRPRDVRARTLSKAAWV